MIPGYYPISLIKFLAARIHINRLLRIVFDRAQATQKDYVSTAPGVDDLDERETVDYISGATIRTYKKINGVVYYQTWTAA